MDRKEFMDSWQKDIYLFGLKNIQNLKLYQLYLKI